MTYIRVLAPTISTQPTRTRVTPRRARAHPSIRMKSMAAGDATRLLVSGMSSRDAQRIRTRLLTVTETVQRWETDSYAACYYLATLLIGVTRPSPPPPLAPDPRPPSPSPPPPPPLLPRPSPPPPIPPPPLVPEDCAATGEPIIATDYCGLGLKFYQYIDYNELCACGPATPAPVCTARSVR